MNPLFQVGEGVYDVITIDSSVVSFANELDGCNMRVVYKKINGAYTAWAVETRSALLASLNVAGVGLYAARRFQGPSASLRRMNERSGDVVGFYQEGADSIASCSDRDEILKIASTAVESGKNKLTIIHSRFSQSYELLDGDSPRGELFPPFYSINDAKNTACRNNLELIDTGMLRARRSIAPVDWEAEHLNDWIGSELCYDYGKKFWDSQSQIGVEHRPIILE
jgi:hypothetical protein